MSSGRSATFNTPEEVGRALELGRREVSDTSRWRVFVAAVKACVDLGSPVGEQMLLRAYTHAPFECRVTILSSLSYFPTDTVADALKSIASDPTDNSSLRGGAVWTLGWFRRQSDGSFLRSAVADPVLREQALRACMNHGTTVPPDTVLQLLGRLDRTKSLSKAQAPPTSFMVLVALFAHGDKDASKLLNRFAKLIERMWPRLTDLDREWIQSYWPEATDKNPAERRMITPQQLKQLAEWADRLPGWQQPMIY